MDISKLMEKHKESLQKLQAANNVVYLVSAEIRAIRLLYIEVDREIRFASDSYDAICEWIKVNYPECENDEHGFWHKDYTFYTYTGRIHSICPFDEKWDYVLELAGKETSK